MHTEGSRILGTTLCTCVQFVANIYQSCSGNMTRRRGAKPWRPGLGDLCALPCGSWDSVRRSSSNRSAATLTHQPSSGYLRPGAVYFPIIGR